MRIALFGARRYEREFFDCANEAHAHEIEFIEPNLDVRTASLAAGFPAVCAFVNDRLGRDTLAALHGGGTRLIALRCAGFNNVDLEAAHELGIEVLRVPAYSPYAVAEHTVGLILALNRSLHRAAARVREQNFSLDGLLGFDLHGRTVGVVGTGNVGVVVTRIMAGFGCRLLAHDPAVNAACTELGARYVEMTELAGESDIITLHCPLVPATRHIIDAGMIARMKPGVMLINTSRGALIDTTGAIDGLKRRQIGSLGIDVYEEEADLFFRDLSGEIIQDDVFARLLTFPNVLITAHQAFFTRDALTAIAETTLQNVTDFERGAVQPKTRLTAAQFRG